MHDISAGTRANLSPNRTTQTDTQDWNGCASDPSFNTGFASISLHNVVRKLFMPKDCTFAYIRKQKLHENIKAIVGS